jgi:hypothetical protein
LATGEWNEQNGTGQLLHVGTFYSLSNDDLLDLCHVLLHFARDVYPTSTAGKWVALCAMMVGVLVIAFPVSVVSDLWAKEIEARDLARRRASTYEEDDEDKDTRPGETKDGSGNDITKKKHHRSAHSESSAFSSRAVDKDALWSSIGMHSFLQNKQENVAGGVTQPLTSGSPTTSNDPAFEKPIPAVIVRDSGTRIVSMQAKDLEEILARLESIRENETRIRGILSRYYQ